ncbi:MAG: FISUMP domain-containing protein [Bacteroidota bacterium]|nr:FISUMP domain-containing protein [Bacteroidota bacterium]
MIKYFYLIVIVVTSACQKEIEIPEVDFKVIPAFGDTSTIFTFEANNSLYIDKSLNYRWDFDSDGHYDKETGNQNQAVAKSHYSGWNTATVEITLKTGQKLSQVCDFLVLIHNSDTSHIVDTRDGERYKIVKLGDRWWLAENLRYGEIISSDSVSSDNLVGEVYVWKNELANLGVYGGLYAWDEVMDYSVIEKAGGLCPAGWHIPSAEEWEGLVVDSLPMQIVWNSVQKGGYWGLNLISGLSHNLQDSVWRSLPEPHSSIAPFGVSYWTSTSEKITLPRNLGTIPFEGRLPYNKNGFNTISNGAGTNYLNSQTNLFPVRCIRNE